MAKGRPTGRSLSNRNMVVSAASRNKHRFGTTTAPVYTPPPPPPPPAPTYSGPTYYSAPAPPAPPPPPRLTDDEWLAKDSKYNAALAALEQKFKDFQTENTASREKGTLDYENALRDLGWIKPGDKGGEGSWNDKDRTTAYGNAFQTQIGDFASRGLLQSTLYDQANTDLLANFNKQRTGLDTTHSNFLEDLARALAQAKTDKQLGRDQARVDALARRAQMESGAG